MADSTVYQDLLAVQKEMPRVHKSAVNGHFGNKYVPLEELLDTVLPILNKHNFALMQSPTTLDGNPALTTALVHVSGERIESTMLLQQVKSDPQSQGSAVTYSRRYSLTALLGISADPDDDGEAATPSYDKVPPRPVGQTRPEPPAFRKVAEVAEGGQKPSCPQGHGPMKLWPGGTSKAGKPYGANWKCTNRDCRAPNGYAESVWATDWEDYLSQKAQGDGISSKYDGYDEVPFDE